MNGNRHSATRHWRNQRLTAVALVPLGLWFLLSLLRQPALDYPTVMSWLGKPLQSLLVALFGGAMLWHSLQGIQVVLEDYAHGRALRVSMALSQFLHGAAALLLAWAVVTIVAGGAR